MSTRFGTDGIRGVANADLGPEVVLALGRAAAREFGAPAFLVGRDTRRSGPLIAAALSTGIAAEGVAVVDVGVVPTPALAFLAASRHLPAAVISASHNPFPDNGIKFFSDAGSKLAGALESAVESSLAAILRGDDVGEPPVGAGVGVISADPEAVEGYLEHLARSVRIDAGRRLKVVCDCANGAASALAPRLFSRLGIEAAVICNEPDGTNINAGCGATDPRLLSETVVRLGYDLGICFDGDADRLIAVDEKGRVVDGDQVIALFAIELDKRGELANRAVALTVMSNLGLRRALTERGIAYVETAVGDRNVVDALEERGLVLGGEQSGHVIFRREATTGDGLLTGLKLIELVGASGVSLGELACSAMTRLPQELRNVPVNDPGRVFDATELWVEVAQVEASLGASGRVLLRPSGTEEAVRVMVETDEREVALAAVERLAAAVARALDAPAGTLPSPTD